jgi:hypothetical protein
MIADAEITVPQPDPKVTMDEEAPASPADEALSASEKREANDQAAMTAMLRRAATKGSADVAKMKLRAAEHRQAANRMQARGDRVGTILERSIADKLDLEADWALEPVLHTTGRVTTGNGNEIAIGTKAMAPFVDTVRERPDMLAVDASRRRMELLDKGNALEIGLDAATTIRVQNSLERALTHQMSMAHVMAMELAAEAQDMLRAYKRSGYIHQHLSVEAGRLLNGSARMMAVYQGGMLTIEKVRSGGTQSVVVTHVNQHIAVGDGGRALVAGQVKAGAKRRKGG